MNKDVLKVKKLLVDGWSFTYSYNKVYRRQWSHRGSLHDKEELDLLNSFREAYNNEKSKTLRSARSFYRQ